MNATREGRRVRLNLPVDVTVFNDDHTIAAKSEGRLHDLSRSGCAFYHAGNLPVGNRVELRIRLTESLARKMNKTELIAHGAIIRSIPEKSGYLLSVRFGKVARTTRPR
jgi:c-di-GMP-binding flagellar brake protein YcgR